MKQRLFFLCVVILLLLTTILVAGTAAANNGSKTNPNPVQISDHVTSSTGEQTIVVRLTDRSPSTVQSTPTDNQSSALRAHANDTQSKLLAYAHDNPHVEVEARLWIINAVVVKVDTDLVSINDIAAIRNVEQIHENYKMSLNSTTALEADSVGSISNVASSQTSSTVSPSLATTQKKPTQALNKINVPAVWESYDARGVGVKIAVVDTGVNPDHPSITISEDNWRCFVDCENVPSSPHDINGHGTHVSGTIVGDSVNDANLSIGVAPKATLMHAKAIGNDGRGDFDDTVLAVQWAVRNNADIVSMSIGTPGYYNSHIRLVRNAQSSGTTIIASSGNSGVGTSISPANVYDSISVGSVNVEPGYPTAIDTGVSNDSISSFSSSEIVNPDTSFYTHPNAWPNSYVVPDIVAPGNLIWSADTDLDQKTCPIAGTTDLTCMRGTSMATPHVAGVVGLMQSKTSSELTPAEIRSALRSTAVDVNNEGTRQGAGRIDAMAAMAHVSDEQANIPNELYGEVTDRQFNKALPDGSNTSETELSQNVVSYIENGKIDGVSYTDEEVSNLVVFWLST